MDNKEYKQLKALKEQYDEELKKVIKRHKTDNELHHAIGKDAYCLYCEQYNDLTKKLSPIITKIEKYARENKFQNEVIHFIEADRMVKKQQTTRRSYDAYEIVLKDGREFLVYSFSVDSCLRLLGVTQEDCSKYVTIQKKYLATIYIEGENGLIRTIQQAIDDQVKKKSFVIAEKAQTKLKFQGACFNEKPIEFFKYNKDNLEQLIQFCSPSPVIETKKFKTTGKVGINSPRGNFSIEAGEVVLKIGQNIFFQLSQKEFDELFIEDEHLVWLQTNTKE